MHRIRKSRERRGESSGFVGLLPHLERNGHRVSEDRPWVYLVSWMEVRELDLVTCMDDTNTHKSLLPNLTN